MEMIMQWFSLEDLAWRLPGGWPIGRLGHSREWRRTASLLEAAWHLGAWFYVTIDAERTTLAVRAEFKLGDKAEFTFPLNTRRDEENVEVCKSVGLLD